MLTLPGMLQFLRSAITWVTLIPREGNKVGFSKSLQIHWRSLVTASLSGSQQEANGFDVELRKGAQGTSLEAHDVVWASVMVADSSATEIATVISHENLDENIFLSLIFQFAQKRRSTYFFFPPEILHFHLILFVQYKY